MTKKKKQLHNFLTSAGAWLFEFLAFFLNWMPDFIRSILVELMGVFFGYMANSMREGLEKNLRVLLTVPEANIAPLSNQIFKNFALTLLDFFFPSDNAKSW